MDDDAAHRIFQNWLDRVVHLVYADDYATWRTTMSCPVLVDSAAGPSAMATEDQLRAKFDQWRRLIVSQNVTQLIRTAHDVRAMSDDQIEGAYVFDLLSDGTQVMPRFISAAVLECEDGHWRATELNSGLPASHLHLIHTTEPGDDDRDTAHTQAGEYTP